MTQFRPIAVGDTSLRVAVEGEGPLVLMVHGFPESWYSWRHQMGPLAAAGFTAAAIDVRGYGGSDKPWPVAAYAMETIVADVAGVIAAISPGVPAVLVGHDWGAPIVWNSALTRPDVVRAVAGLSVPYMGVPSRSLSALIEEAYTSKGRFFYQHYFLEEGVAEAELEADVRGALRKFYYSASGDASDDTWPRDKPVGDTLLRGLPDPDPFPAWLTAEDLDYYVAEFEASGFRGPINRYRNHDRDFAWLSGFRGRTIDQPSLFIGGERDPVLSMFGRVDFVPLMKSQLTDLRGHDILSGCGHWTQQECPEAVNDRLIPWLKGLS